MTHGDYVLQLLQKLKIFDWLSCPEVFIEDDGDVSLDWDINRHNSLTVSVSSTGRVGWSSLIGEDSAYGHFQLPEWNKELENKLIQMMRNK